MARIRPQPNGIKLMALSQSEREKYGIIADFSDGRARWFQGTDGIKDAAKYADKHKLKIKTISSPRTIYRDLQGKRDGRKTTEGREEFGVYFPEVRFLGQIHRPDLLDDSIPHSTNRGRRIPNAR